jgi:hypothetical protein
LLGSGDTAWPLYGAADPTLVFDSAVSTMDGIRTPRCDFWQPLYDSL